MTVKLTHLFKCSDLKRFLLVLFDLNNQRKLFFHKIFGTTLPL